MAAMALLPQSLGHPSPTREAAAAEHTLHLRGRGVQAGAALVGLTMEPQIPVAVAGAP